MGYEVGTMILENVTLNVQLEDRIGIVGANGGGKSSLAKLIAQELSPQRGTITYHPNAKVYIKRK